MNNPRIYALTRVKLIKFNVLIDFLGFYDNPISSETKKYEELLKLTTACDLPKQKRTRCGSKNHSAVRNSLYVRDCFSDFDNIRKIKRNNIRI